MFDNTLFHVMRVLLQEHTARWTTLVPDLTKPQYAVLEALMISGDLDQIALGHASATTKATLTEMLGRMEQRGLIERQNDKTDKRRRIVRLTAVGEAKLVAIRPFAESITNSMMTGLSAQEQETLIALLAKVRKGVAATQEQC
ncbi:MarR family transcriptional regulator [Samsonia erythrinae]|uniref:MarR family transcriptional regulator n=2 Tax=Samsonia erythrinae TaxID=160434 RepID=A0A4R3VUJ9_9GAMM|nr:MarR family transcriptional regulator [Samsonia erythrinae]